MANQLDISGLLRGLDLTVDRMLEGSAQGLDQAARQATNEMQGTSRHGDVTGATRASYIAFRVGRGRDGRREVSDSLGQVEARNPGRSASAPVEIVEPLGVIFMSGTNYQRSLEIENAGQKAVLGPTVARYARICIEAAARGSKQNLS